MSSKLRGAYISNYSEWIDRQIDSLYYGDNTMIDIAGLIETLYLVKEDRYIEAHRALASLLMLILTHDVKNNNDMAIHRARKRLRRLIDPTIFKELKRHFHSLYRETYAAVFGETLPEDTILPVTLEKCMNLDAIHFSQALKL